MKSEAGFCDSCKEFKRIFQISEYKKTETGVLYEKWLCEKCADEAWDGFCETFLGRPAG